jgi:hypothetical protein
VTPQYVQADLSASAKATADAPKRQRREGGQVRLQDLVADLLNEVNDLPLRAQIERALTVTLRAADATVNRENIRAGQALLNVFVIEVRTLKNRRLLSASIADPLISQAQAVAGGP